MSRLVPSGCAQTTNAFDWSQTPLGPQERWSGQLRQAVENALGGTERRDVPTPEETLDALFSEAPLGLAILDRSCQFIRVNEALAAINGVAATEHLGCTPAELLPDIANLDQILDRWRKSYVPANRG